MIDVDGQLADWRSALALWGSAMDLAFVETVEAYVTSTNTEGDDAVVDRLERLILEHIPRTIAEAVAMLDVIIPNVELGGRSDGADLRALEAVRAYLRGDA